MRQKKFRCCPRSGKELSRGLFWIGVGGDGRMGLLAQFDRFEIRALVFLLKRKRDSALINSAARCCTKFSVNDKIFGDGKHDVVTTWE